MRKLLVANRSEIAIRVFRAATELGLGTVAVFTHEDRFALHRHHPAVLPLFANHRIVERRFRDAPRLLVPLAESASRARPSRRAERELAEGLAAMVRIGISFLSHDPPRQGGRWVNGTVRISTPSANQLVLYCLSRFAWIEYAACLRSPLQ